MAEPADTPMAPQNVMMPVVTISPSNTNTHPVAEAIPSIPAPAVALPDVAPVPVAAPPPVAPAASELAAPSVSASPAVVPKPTPRPGELQILRGADGDMNKSDEDLTGNGKAVWAVNSNGLKFHVTDELAEKMKEIGVWVEPDTKNYTQAEIDKIPNGSNISLTNMEQLKAINTDTTLSGLDIETQKAVGAYGALDNTLDSPKDKDKTKQATMGASFVDDSSVIPSGAGTLSGYTPDK